MRGAEGEGTSASPAGPVAFVPYSSSCVNEPEHAVNLDKAVLKDVLFQEFFAGDANLSEAMGDIGFDVAMPEDLAKGGVDFSDESQVLGLKTRLRKFSEEGRRLCLHLAPPCATFSGARDRSFRTRLRSGKFPEGLPSCRNLVEEANKVAEQAYDLATWAAEELCAVVSMENPRNSYLWDFVAGLPQTDSEYSDVLFCSCFQKPNRLRCWNWHPTKLEKMCSLEGDRFTCGGSRLEGHTVLEFGSLKTSVAASYGKKLCREWADALAEAVAHDNTTVKVLESTSLHSEGRVRRHQLRGEDAESRRERRRAEDQASMAGCRNPADLITKWPRLWSGMDSVAEVIRECWEKDQELQGLSGCCGALPVREPPSEEAIGALRRRVAEVLGVDASLAEEHNAASSWRPALVEAVQARTGDPDKHIASWLRDGAPMGITKEIAPGMLFPQVDAEAAITVEQLNLLDRVARNHPSFGIPYEGERPPGEELVEGYVQKGFGKLYATADEASAKYGQDVHPAPMGTVSKLKADGSYKHRVIQDLRRNGVNDAVRLPERQVLPRPLDHARDVARLMERGQGQDLKVLVLDFKDAFMSVPLAESEKPIQLCSCGSRR